MVLVGGERGQEAQHAGVQLFAKDAAQDGIETGFIRGGHAAALRAGAGSLAARTKATSRLRLSAGMRPVDKRSIAKDTDTLADRFPASRS